MIREEYSYWISNIEGIGARKIELLIQAFDSLEEIFHATKEEIIHKTNLKEVEIDSIIGSRVEDKIQEKYAKLIMSGIYFVSKEDERYPSKLKDIYGAPYALYFKGNLPRESRKSIAIIGARECTNYGKEIAKYLAGAIAGQGIEVLSGLARGIDSYAHEGALSVGGSTFGILGCGIDICYPRENINLYMDMQKEGGIISEYAPGIPPIACNFPMRNRIISGLSDGILVIEAKEKSGSLITVDMGLEQGKDIYALPGRVTDRLSDGCNNLIKMGAKLVTSPEDILEDLLPSFQKSVGDCKENNNMLKSKEKIVYACLNLVPKHIEEIAHETNLQMNQLMEYLLSLELRDLIHQTVKNYYVTSDYKKS